MKRIIFGGLLFIFGGIVMMFIIGAISVGFCEMCVMAHGG